MGVPLLHMDGEDDFCSPLSDGSLAALRRFMEATRPKESELHLELISIKRALA